MVRHTIRLRVVCRMRMVMVSVRLMFSVRDSVRFWFSLWLDVGKGEGLGV